MPILKLDGDSSGAVRATADVNAEAKKLVPTFREVGDATQRAGQSHQEAFGAQSVGELVKYGAEMLTIKKAIELANQALERQAELKKKAAEEATGGLPGAGEIANVSPTPEAYAHNIAVARRIQSQGIVPQGQESLAEHAAAGMAGAELTPTQEEFMLKLGKQKRIPGGQLGEFSGGVRGFEEGFGIDPKKFERDAKEIIAASADTLGKASPTDVAKQVGDLANKAKESGLTSEETLAKYTAIQRTAKSPKSASARLKSVFEDNEELTKTESERYAIELPKLQKAGGSDTPDYVATDPGYRAARGAEEAGAEYQGEFKRNTQESTSLYQQLHTYNRQNIRRNLGYGVMGGTAVAVDESIEGIGSKFGQEESALRNVADTPSAAEKYPAEFISDLKEHFQRQEQLMIRQTELMESDHRSIPPPSGRQE